MLRLGKLGRSCAAALQGREDLWRQLLQGGQVGVEVGYGFDAAEIIFQGQVLVGGVGVFVWQAEADKDAGHFEGVVHLGDEGN